MRVFVAVDISDEARRLIAKRIENFRPHFSDLRVGWEKPEKLHLTVKFLGDTPEAKLAEIIAAVENSVAEINPFSISIEGVGAFPPRGAARVLWLGVKDENLALQKIQKRLESECEKIGFERENRIFNPHLTVARLKEPAKSRELTQLHLKTDFPPAKFDVPEIVIYKSDLQPNGSVYSPLAKIPLEEKKARRLQTSSLFLKG